MYYKNLKKTVTQENGKTFITLSGKCMLNSKEYQVTMEEKMYNILEQGMNIGPLIGFDKMEFLISGICPESWDELTKE